MEREFAFNADGILYVAYVRRVGQIDGIGDKSLVIGYRQDANDIRPRKMLPGLFDHRLSDKAVCHIILDHAKRGDVLP